MSDAIYIVSGIPGAGKTTVARLLAQQFDRSVHIESDHLQEWIVSGGRWPNEEPYDEAQRQLRLRARNACLLAESYFDGGFTPVIDDVVIGSRLHDFLGSLRHRPVRFVLLTPTPEVVRRRDAGRERKHVFSVWGHLDQTMRAETPHVGLWLDSSGLSPEETVDQILVRTAEAEITTPPMGPTQRSCMF